MISSHSIAAFLGALASLDDLDGALEQLFDLRVELTDRAAKRLAEHPSITVNNGSLTVLGLLQGIVGMDKNKLFAVYLDSPDGGKLRDVICDSATKTAGLVAEQLEEGYFVRTG